MSGTPHLPHRDQGGLKGGPHEHPLSQGVKLEQNFKSQWVTRPKWSSSVMSATPDPPHRDQGGLKGGPHEHPQGQGLKLEQNFKS